jgi:outer membrane protein assembly factor BamE (lipoprotein component of BamABCDE complex)
MLGKIMTFSIYRHSVKLAWPFLVCLVILAGCSSFSSPVRHLSSDVCLVMPESTTRQEVLSFLGEPDKKITTADNGETWLYLKVKKSFSRKMPLVGERLGSHDYETVTVTFDADLVKTCFYRQFDEDEFSNFITGLE